MPTLLSLPLEVLNLILGDLELRDILRTCSTCQDLRHAFRADCLAKIVQSFHISSIDLRDAIAESSHLLRCHALLAACEKGSDFNREALVRSGASLASIEYGRNLELAIVQGDQRLVTTLLSHGSTLKRLPNGIDRLIEIILNQDNGRSRSFECLADALVQERDWEELNPVLEQLGHMELLPPHLAEYCQFHYAEASEWVASVLDKTSNGVDRVLDNMLLQNVEVKDFFESANALDELLGSDERLGRWSKWMREAIDSNEHLTLLDDEGYPPLVLAVGQGYPGFAKMLITRGAPINLPSAGKVTPLYAGAMMGDTEAVKILLNAGADTTIVNSLQSTPLHVAAYRNHREATQELVNYGVNLNALNNSGWTPLFNATWEGAIKTVQVLIDAGADLTLAPTDNPYDSWPPLYVAVKQGHLEILEMLIQAGADPTAPTPGGWYPIHAAAIEGHLRCLEILHAHGADLHVANSDGSNAVHLAAAGGHLGIIEWLAVHDVEIDVKGMEGVTALRLATEKGDLDIIQWLLHRGADINKCDDNGTTPLLQAIVTSGEEVARFLVDHGADVNIANDNGTTPLMLAATQGFAFLARMLLDHHALVDCGTSDGTSAMHVACSSDHLAVVQILVDSADVNVQDGHGGMPLHFAALYGHIEIVELLLDHGAILDVLGGVAINGAARLTTLHAASLMGHADITELLIARGARLDISGYRGWLPIHHTANEGRPDITRLLLTHGSEVDPREIGGETPLHLAASKGHLEVARILIEQHAQSSAQNDVGWTPLYYAAMAGHLDLVNLLPTTKVEHDIFQRTPLHRAINLGHIEVARVLARYADSTIDGYGRTVYDWANHINERELLPQSSPVPGISIETRLRQSICNLAKRLLEAKSRGIFIGFEELGHCLIYLREFDDAILSFQQQSNEVENVEAMYDVACWGCDEDIKGCRFVCIECSEVDFCATCVELPLRTEKNATCAMHQFLEVKELVPLGDEISLDIQEWLRGLLAKYEAELSHEC